MANTAIVPTFLIDDIESIRNTVTIDGHSFVAGDVIRYDLVNAAYAKAIASSETDSPQEAAINAEAIGIVEIVNGSSVTIVYKGEINISVMNDAFGNPITNSTESVYYLSPITAGKLTPVPPSQDIQVIKPMLVRSDGDIGIVVNYIGTMIGGQSLVSLNAVQPVGTIMPYAGASDSLPNNWELCDGGFVDVMDYPKYYEVIATRYGWKATIDLSSSSSLATLAGNIAANPTAYLVVVGGIQAQCVAVVTSASNTMTLAVRDYPSLKTTRDQQAVSVIGAGSAQIALVANPTTPIASSLTASNVVVTHAAKPDLQSRFIVGAGTESLRGFDVFDLAEQGGVQNTTLSVANLPGHEHPITNTLTIANSGSHTHPIVATIGGTDIALTMFGNMNGGGANDAPRANDTTTNVGTINAGSAGSAHSHTINGSISSSSVGGGNEFTNLPPYMAMNWIIRISPDGAASLNLVDIAIVNDLQIEDLIDVDALTPSDGQILVYDGASSKYKLSNLFTGYTADSSLKIRQSNGFIGAGWTLAHAVLTVANTTDQLALIDSDSTGVTYGGHVLVSQNGLLHFNNCNRPTAAGITLTSSTLPTLTIDAENQGVGIRTGSGIAVNGLLEVKGASSGVPLFNISSAGLVSVGETAGATGHSVTIKNTNGTSLLLKNGTSTTGSTLGSIAFGTQTNSTTWGAAIFANYRGVSGSVSKISMALNVSDGNTLTNALYLAETLKVGVGTQSPGYQLHVVGATGSGIAYTAGSATNFFGLDTTGGVLGTTSNHALQFITNNTKRVVVDTSGNLGINVATPDSLIHSSVSSSTNRMRMRNSASTGFTLDLEAGATFGRIVVDGGPFSIYTNGSQTIFANLNKVGVGTTTLTEKLNVNGSVLAQNAAKGWVDFSSTGVVNASVNNSVVTVSNPGDGRYIVTHGMNSSNYAVSVTVGSTGAVFANVYGKSGNTFEIRAYSSSSSGVTTGLHSLSAMWYSI